ncbi:hypothetical protein NWE55_16885 (plasmid) [Myroides albus]|uniref:DUF4133 domain-containing protein n=1 Tax=Myroides odoratimimus TaxID=76832 RepID=A0AAI8C7I5_9FLAO|nr:MULTISPECIES: hypothetical protein [Myroides]ALU28429.1 hypothetical protein AS202_19810 [Myroides odoratimimus]ALU28499.1 hypothetical protein AS202_20180 [Myroides odoratimimus]UVD81348.1 hypothetical protein NWE55_16885 [Myroides albus]
MSKKRLYLRNYDEYRLLRNVSDPLLFLGVPLKISIISLMCIVFSIGIGFFLHLIHIPGIIAIIVSVALLTLCTVGVRVFYKKYGVYGYELKRREKLLTNAIIADIPLAVLLKKRLK